MQGILCYVTESPADNEWAVNPRMAGITESPCESEKEEEEMVERQDKEGAAMGEWGIFSHPAEKGRHAWTGGGGRGNQGIKALDLVISLTPLTRWRVTFGEEHTFISKKTHHAHVCQGGDGM